MGVHLNDLPPKVREQVARKMVQKATPQSRKRDSSPCAGEPFGERIATSAAPPADAQRKWRRQTPPEDAGPRNDSTGEALGKYHNQKAVRYVGDNAIRFDSQKEARRFDELMLLQKAGKIRELKLQVDFTLQEAYTMPDTGNRVRAIRYRADFTYLERVGDDFGYTVDRDVEIATSASPPRNDKPGERIAATPAGCRNDETEVHAATSPSGLRPATSPCAGEALGWRLVVEDVKSDGTRTREYGIKRKLMAEKYGVQIKEI